MFINMYITHRETSNLLLIFTVHLYIPSVNSFWEHSHRHIQKCVVLASWAFLTLIRFTINMNKHTQ